MITEKEFKMDNINITKYVLLINLYDYHSTEIAKRVVISLQELKVDLLSSEDSGLKNTWEEICIQVQNDYSFDWKIYSLTIENIIKTELEKEPEPINQLLSYIGDEKNVEEYEISYNPEIAIKNIYSRVMEMAKIFELVEI